MTNTRKMWVFSPSKQSKFKVPDTGKVAVETKANDLIETVLKPKYIKPPSGDERSHYIVEIYSKWYRNYFYFWAKYACPGSNAISPFFETKFARLEYVGNGCFNLSYLRHTGQWWEVYTDLSLDESLATTRNEALFQP